jgi:hypothetical protein
MAIVAVLYALGVVDVALLAALDLRETPRT